MDFSHLCDCGFGDLRPGNNAALESRAIGSVQENEVWGSAVGIDVRVGRLSAILYRWSDWVWRFESRGCGFQPQSFTWK